MKKILLYFFLANVFIGKDLFSQSPAWLWAKSAGGPNADGAYSIGVDASGNTYVAGYFYSASIVIGSTTLTNDTTNNTADLLIVKYDSTGNVLWAKSAGGSSHDFANSVTVDASGNTYVAGYFGSPSITFGSTTLTNPNAGYAEIFLAKYDTNGNILWAKSNGGTDHDYAFSVAMDLSGNVLVTGYFLSSTIVFGSTTLTNAGTVSMFLVKYDFNGNVIWAKSQGGSGQCNASSVASDASGNTYVTGYFGSPSIIFGSTTLTSAGSWDMFLVKYDTNGNVLWANKSGGTGAEYAKSVNNDASGNVFVAGTFSSSTITFGSTTLNNACGGGDNMFLVKYDLNGNVLWAKSAGGVCQNYANSVIVDASGNVLISGYFDGISIVFGTTTLTNAVTTTYDMFIAKYDFNGNVLWAKSAGGSNTEYSFSISTNASGNTYLAGKFQSSTITFGPTTLTNAGGDDMFLAKLASFICAVSVNTGIDTSICYGSSTILNGSASGGVSPYSYLWSSGQTTVSVTVSPSVTTAYILTVTDSNNCSNSDTVVVTVNPISDATINPAGPFCVNDAPINLTAVQGGGGWFGNGIIDTIAGTFIPSVAGSGTHLITYRIIGSCSDTDTVLIVVNPQLDATITTSTGPYCTNDSPVTLTAVNGGGTFSGSGVTGNTFYPSSLPAGTYAITYIISGSCGDTGTINMQVQPCASSISGTIFNSDYSSQVTTGKVFLLNYDTSAVQLSTADIFVLNGINGNYIFTNVSPGDYLILVRPDSNNYSNAIPTYFGDTAYWYFASVLNLTSDTAGINIGVGEMTALAGNGFISGFIQYGIGTGKTGSGTVIPFGDPVPGIDISLEQIPGGIKVHTNTDQNGIYTFSNLEMNSTYKLLVDIPGLPMDSSYTLTTSSSDSVFTGLDFVVDTTSESAGIYIGYPLSTTKLTVQNLGFRVYPNPNDGKFTLQITNDEITNNEVKIYNVFGEMVYKSSITNPRFVIDFSNQPNGIYLVQVKSENNIYYQKLLKQ